MNTTTEKELTFEVSEAEYQEGLAKGWNDDDMLRPGTYKVRRAKRIAKPDDAQIKVSMLVDFHTWQHFRKRAEKLNVKSYEELMAAELRAAMEREQKAEQSAIEKLLSNTDFVAAVAAKLAELQAAKQPETSEQVGVSQEEPELQAA